MTSVPFNIGYDETRRSSRVLRPPGGGHSDIFGTSSPTPNRRTCLEGSGKGGVTPVPEENEPKSEPQAVQKPDGTTLTDKKTEENAPGDGKGDENPSTNGKDPDVPFTNGKGDETKPDLKKDEKQAEPVPAQMPAQRKRVPPGGYCTKLW